MRIKRRVLNPRKAGLPSCLSELWDPWIHVDVLGCADPERDLENTAARLAEPISRRDCT